jgi:thiol-disulfide isomerase/thioredoxin
MRRAVLSLLLACLLLTAAFAQTRPSPNFTVRRVGKEAPVKIESLRGKIVVLTFILTTCPHCQDLTQNTLIPVSKEYSRRGVEIVECAMDDGAEKALPEFIARFKPTFTVGYAPSAEVNAYTQRSVIDQRPFYVPHIVFIDRQGVIKAEYTGESTFVSQAPKKMREELDKMLAIKAPAAKGRGGRTSKSK